MRRLIILGSVGAALFLPPSHAFAVEAVYPPDGARVGPTPTLGWALAPGESSFRLAIAPAGSPGQPVYVRTLAPGDQSQVVDTPLEPGPYLWQVEARALLLFPTYSAPRGFVVGEVRPPPRPLRPPRPPPPVPRPCTGASAERLRCPDLVMARPYDLYLDRTTRPGRALLRATSAIHNLGRGPVELRGRRTGRREMAARQHIHRRAGGFVSYATGAELYFFFIPGQGRYWKAEDAARFQLWSLDSAGRRRKLVRRGPKQYYCFRDLTRTHPRPSSPRYRQFPGCSQNPGVRGVTLGTSVGWSDIYPASYPEQWIDVTGLRGCFAYRLVADPEDRILELRERNNAAQRIVRLPYRAGRSAC
jgi:Lysyl oxidase